MGEDKFRSMDDLVRLHCARHDPATGDLLKADPRDDPGPRLVGVLDALSWTSRTDLRDHAPERLVHDVLASAAADAHRLECP